MRQKRTEAMNEKRKDALPDLSALKIDGRARSSTKRGRGFVIACALAAAAAVAVLALVVKGDKTVVAVGQARAVNGSEGAAILNASGYVTPRVRATVAAKITGRVQEMLVEEGMHVEEGQILARLDSSDARERQKAAEAELRVARASIADIQVNLADARRTLARIQNLQKQGVASNQDLDSAQAAVDSFSARLVLAQQQVQAAQAQLDVARQDVENCIVRSPFTGIAVSKDAQVGEMVSPISAGGGFTRTGIATIVDMNSLEIEVDVNESYLAKVSTGQKVDAALDAYPEWHMPATVRTIIPTADRQKATVKVRISFDRLDPKILPDMGVKVTFLSTAPGDGKKNMILVKREAVREAGGTPFVFVYKDGRIHRRTIKTGERLESEIEALEGVAPGEQLVISGPESLKDGQRAEVKK